jgi:hypothetical protein
VLESDRLIGDDESKVERGDQPIIKLLGDRKFFPMCLPTKLEGMKERLWAASSSLDIARGSHRETTATLRLAPGIHAAVQCRSMLPS